MFDDKLLLSNVKLVHLIRINLHSRGFTESGILVTGRFEYTLWICGTFWGRRFSAGILEQNEFGMDCFCRCSGILEF